MASVYSRFVMVDGIKTHYLEAGSGPPLVLLHSGEFGGCAELSWEHNIKAFARYFHVYAPDWLGYGRTDKLFSFENMWGFRIRHITGFLRTVCIERAHFIGNSMGGTMLLGVAAMEDPSWDMDKIVVVSGGGHIPENSARDILNSYDGTREHMRKIVETMFVDPQIRNNEAYIERRWKVSRELGAWECTAAVRFKAPWREPSGMPKPPDYSRMKVPVLLITGAQDCLREPNFGPTLQAQIPGAQLHVAENAGHCSQIDVPEEFHSVVLDFLNAK
jgi:2-hydroxymuconate-semialdehyde hydrolase